MDDYALHEDLRLGLSHDEGADDETCPTWHEVEADDEDGVREQHAHRKHGPEVGHEAASQDQLWHRAFTSSNQHCNLGYVSS